MAGKRELSLEERDRRYAAIRQQMKDRQLDHLLIWGHSGKWDSKTANVRYVTQVGGNGEETMVIFSMRGEPTVILWSGIMIEEWLTSQSWVRDFIEKRPNWSSATIQALKQKGFDSGRVGIVGLEGREAEGDIPYVTFQRLKEGLPNVVFENATDILEGLRLIKSTEELLFMEKAMEIADIGAMAMYETARPGVEESEVYASLISAMIRAGSENPIMALWRAGEPDRATRLTYTRGRALQPGDVIVTEYSARFSGYYSHSQRPLALGAPRPPYGQLFEAALESYQNGMAALRPGITVGQLLEVCQEPVTRRGLEFYKGPFFHGIGLGWEAPAGFANMTQGLDEVLKENVVLAFENGAACDNRSKGVHVGDLVVVTADGCRSLSKMKVECVRV